MDYDLNLPLPAGKQEQLDNNFNIEAEFMADAGYADAEDAAKALHRKNASKLFFTATDSAAICLAMNYFDRFMSKEGTGVQVIEDIFGDFFHFTVCCFSLAGKTRMANFTYNEFLSEEDRQRFKRDKVVDMELAILCGLRWRMEAVTALNFVDYFFYRIRQPKFAGIVVAAIIRLSIVDIRLTRFKPSIIAASCFLTTAFFYLESVNYLSFKEQIHSDPKLNRMELSSCTEIITELCVQRNYIPKLRQRKRFRDPEEDSNQREGHAGSSRARGGESRA